MRPGHGAALHGRRASPAPSRRRVLLPHASGDPTERPDTGRPCRPTRTGVALVGQAGLEPAGGRVGHARADGGRAA